jgi:hypothetical protein
MFILLLGSCCSLFVILLLVKKKINERNTLVWLAGSIGIFVLSAYPGLLNWIGRVLGVDYPPSLLFLISTLLLLIVVLHQSMQISVLNEKVKQLAQAVALLSVESPGKEGLYDESGHSAD